MQEGQKGFQHGRSETLPRTVHRTVVEEVAAAVAGNGEAGMSGWESSAVDEYACSLKSQESWNSAGRTGCPAGFYQF